MSEEMSKTRKEAIEKGERFYNTGKACKWGHYAKRVTTGGQCHACVLLRAKTDEAKEASRKQLQKLRDRRGEEYKQYQREYHLKYKDTVKGRAALTRAQKKYEAKLKRKKNDE